MNMTKFKILAGGTGGIEINANEFLRSGEDFVIVDQVNRKRKLIVPDYVLAEVAKLKYYFLILMGYWHPRYSGYFDTLDHVVHPINKDSGEDHLLLKDLWNRTEVTGAYIENGNFVITGKIESVTDKFVGLSTPKISMDDDFGFYDQCMTMLEHVSKVITSYLKDGVLALDSYKERMPSEIVDGKSVEEIRDMVINDLQEKGAIIMMGDMDMRSLNGGDFDDDGRVFMSGSIDSDMMPAAEEVEEKEEEEEEEVQDEQGEQESQGYDVPQTEDPEFVSTDESDPDFVDPDFGPTKVDVFGKPASEAVSGGVPEDVGAYENSEYSDKHLLEEDDNEW